MEGSGENNSKIGYWQKCAVDETVTSLDDSQTISERFWQQKIVE